MKKTNKGKRLLLVSLCLVLAGLVLGVAALALGAKTQLTVVYPFQIILQDETPQQITEDIAPFTSLDIESNRCAIVLVPSDHYGLSMEYYGQRPVYTVENQDGLLRVRETSEEVITLFEMNFSQPKRDQITLYFPASLVFDAVRLQTRAGDLRLQQVQAKQLDLYTKSGGALLDQLQADNLTLRADYGDLSLENVEAEKTDLQAQAGDITIRSSQLGTAQVTDGYGDIHAEAITSQGLTLTSDTGNVTLSGDLQGATRISLHYGDLTLHTARPLTDYGLQLAASYGTVTVDGQEMPSRYQKEGTFAHTIQMQSDSGDASLTFGGASPV